MFGRVTGAAAAAAEKLKFQTIKLHIENDHNII